MLELSLHIEYLLLRHDCVVVPGIGAFINVYQPAHFDNDAQTWMPMTREVRFNSAITHDDGLLASSVARKNEVSFVDGRELVNRMVSTLVSALDADREATLGHLGILHKSDEGILSFRPQFTASQWASALGYYAAPKLRSDKTAPLQNLHEASANIAETVSDAAVPVATEHRFDTQRNYYIPINKMFARIAGAFVLFAVVTLSLMIPGRSLMDSDTVHHDKASVVPIETILRSAQPKSEPVASRQPSEQEKETAEDHTPADFRYHAIVATFNTEAEADDFIAQFSGAAADGLYVVNTASRSRVAAAGSDNIDDLRRIINNAEFRSRWNESWVWERR